MKILLFIALWMVLLPARGGTELSERELKDAKKLYLIKCSKCHELYDPLAYTDEDWKNWMLKMKKKSKLRDSQFELLNSYLRRERATRAP